MARVQLHSVLDELPPDANGDAVQAYLIQAVTELAREHRRIQSSWFKKQITLGNILLLVAWFTTIIALAMRGEQHMADKNLHRTLAEAEQVFDNRFAIKEAPMEGRLAAIDRQIASFDGNQQKVLSNQDEIMRLLHHQHREAP